MTWGTIEATPVTLRTSGDDMSVGPFRVREADRREELAHKMARKAKRSLADSGREGVAAGGGGGSTSSRRSAMEASVRGGATPGGVTPRRSATDLSPAARSLLGRTKPGKALEGGLAREKQWSEDEERRRLERARQRAREVESRDRLRRERWTVSPARARLLRRHARRRHGWSLMHSLLVGLQPSPAVSLGFDPDLP